MVDLPQKEPSLTPLPPRLERAIPLRGIGGAVCALVLALGNGGVLVADEPSTPVTLAIVQQALADLSSPEFTHRQAAEQRLIALGPPAFEPLVAALDKAPLDAGQRLLLILEQIWLQTPEPQSDILERQLESLRLSVGPYQPAVEHLLFAHHRMREQRAVRALRRLNAVVEEEEDLDELDLQMLPGQPLPNVLPTSIEQIILPRSWKGTEADLWHIQRLAHLKTLAVFVVENNGITPSAKLGMQSGFPGLTVIDRAEVFIGVVNERFSTQPGCRVGAIQAGSPAELAGLRVGDTILSVDGKEIRNFDGLVNALKTKHGYQPIELKVDRWRDSRYDFPPEGRQAEPPEGRPAEPLTLVVIGIPWEARRVLIPPPPPLAESIPDREFPENLILPGHDLRDRLRP